MVIDLTITALEDVLVVGIAWVAVSVTLTCAVVWVGVRRQDRRRAAHGAAAGPAPPGTPSAQQGRAVPRWSPRSPLSRRPAR